MDSALLLYFESYYDDPAIGPKSAEAILNRMVNCALSHLWTNAKAPGYPAGMGDPLINLFKEIMSNGSN